MLQVLDNSATVDAWRETRKQRQAFMKVRNAELNYAKQLRKIAKHINDLVLGLKPTDTAGYDMLQRILEQYSYLLRPWAKSVGESMLAEVNRRDMRAWREHSQFMGIELKRELLNTPIGEELGFMLERQVDLITSLPRDAARRVHDLVTGNLYSGARHETVAAQILQTGAVTASRAELIARTETARAASTLTLVRAKSVGSPGYVWRTARDFRVRPEIGVSHFAKLNTLAMGSHRKLEGTYHLWSDPPVIDPKGIRGHPGTIWNCRCFAEPVLPDLAGNSSG